MPYQPGTPYQPETPYQPDTQSQSRQPQQPEQGRRHSRATQLSRQEAATELSYRVIPAVDTSQGTVTFVVNGQWERHWHPEPLLIARALAQSVRPVRWFPARKVLTLTVAAAGRHAGVEKHFSFVPASREILP